MMKATSKKFAIVDTFLMVAAVVWSLVAVISVLS